MASEEKTANPTILRSRRCSSSALGNGRPTSRRLSTDTAGGRPLLGGPGQERAVIGSHVVGHGSDDDALLEEQLPLEEQGGLVVKQVLPPPPHDELRDEHRHDVVLPP